LSAWKRGLSRRAVLEERKKGRKKERRIRPLFYNALYSPVGT
jgi:hypothetical protein